MLNEFLDNRDKKQPNHTEIVNLTHLAEKLSEFRSIIGRMDITSGYRSIEWNSNPIVGGSKNSYHIKGLAVDFERKNSKGKEDWSNWTPESLIAVANYLGFGNIGVYINRNTKAILFVHLDLGKPWDNGYYDWIRYSDTMSFKIIER
ncbi:MAG: DUF882 domain-containing protein [Candidatus Moranbacteria bacterium]|nr:DUF882 domain-containing protein [Candidatus Moranbacteria bacterium]